MLCGVFQSLCITRNRAIAIVVGANMFKQESIVGEKKEWSEEKVIEEVECNQMPLCLTIHLARDRKLN